MVGGIDNRFGWGKARPEGFWLAAGGGDGEDWIRPHFHVADQRQLKRITCIQTGTVAPRLGSAGF